MAAGNGVSLRPEWVLQIAREVDVFLRSLGGAATEPSRLDRFLMSLPPPEHDFERQFLDDLRARLSHSHGLIAERTRAERAQQLLIFGVGDPDVFVKKYLAFRAERL